MRLCQAMPSNGCQVVTVWEQIDIQQGACRSKDFKTPPFLSTLTSCGCFLKAACLRDCLLWIGEKNLWHFWTMRLSPKKKEMWAKERTFHVTYPGCTGTQSSLHISWLLPQDSQIISLPWRGTSSTAPGCLTEHDIHSVCVRPHLCVCSRGAETSNYLHFLQTACPPRLPAKLAAPLC